MGGGVPFGIRTDVLPLVLSLPVVAYSSMVFFRGALTALRNRTLDMMMLVSTSVAIGWVYSVAVVLGLEGEHFFEATSLLAFVLFGHWMEMRVSRPWTSPCSPVRACRFRRSPAINSSARRSTRKARSGRGRARSARTRRSRGAVHVRCVVLGLRRAAASALLFAITVVVIVFDKTGTLTMGEPAVADVRVADGPDETELRTSRLR